MLAKFISKDAEIETHPGGNPTRLTTCLPGARVKADPVNRDELFLSINEAPPVLHYVLFAGQAASGPLHMLETRNI